MSLVEEIFEDAPSPIDSPVITPDFAQVEEILQDAVDTSAQPEDSSSMSLAEELFEDAPSPVTSLDDSPSLDQDDEPAQDAINSVVSPEDSEDESVEPARDAQRQATIQLQQFMPECCAVGKEQACTARDLYLAYLMWCDQNLIPPMLQRNFGLGLTQLGFQRRRRSHGQHWWLGISVNAGAMGKMAA